ncbi:hypothetical protein ACQP1V_01965 [Microtetraspora malaysiensis]|uniref:hypothetical protein n=1 Tax=Microtetraspora malaysiensis TaxID=161358 RepID=UPI003D9093E6
MTTLRDHLHSIAVGAPTVDLTERVIRKATRRRAGVYASGAAAVLAVVVAAVTVIGGRQEGDIIASKVTDTLPASGVGPLKYAYYDFCGEKWTPGVNTHLFAKECAQWNVVTRTGETYRMPEALSVYTEQTADNYMNTGAPLVISADGGRVAYYSEKDRKIAVRDLDSGRVWLMPTTLSRAEMVAKGVMLALSPGGTRMGIWGGSGQDLVVEVETGNVSRVPEGWHVRTVGDGGDPVVVTREGKGGGLGALTADGTVRAFPPTDDVESVDLSQPSPDGGAVAFLAGMKGGLSASGALEESKPNDTIVVLDSTTGEILHKARLRGVPRDFQAWRAGGWLSRTEVIVSGPALDDSWGKSGGKGTPVLGERTYRVNVRTGQVTPLAAYTYAAWGGSLELPGF